MDDTTPRPMKVKATRTIGIDYGAARIGVSVSDERKIIAKPLMTIKAEKKSDLTVAKVVAELSRDEELNNYAIDEIVVGLPLMMSGKVGLQADEVKHFVMLLSKVFAVPIITWDERLTTVQADRSLREGSMTRKQRSKVVDEVAAVILLQSYLDSKCARFNRTQDIHDIHDLQD